jgi:hypothetical protein
MYRRGLPTQSKSRILPSGSFSSGVVRKYQRPKGGTMDTTKEKWIADAARYFKEEILDFVPDIPLEELSNMVGEYIYYQQTDASKTETRKIVEATCR